jgi:glycyl-tRNA synthetase
MNSSILNSNGLVIWEEKEIRMRNHLIEWFDMEVQESLKRINPGWQFFRIEAPCLIPRALISPAYTETDLYVQQSLKQTDAVLVLRPETTPASYVFAVSMLEKSATKPPLVVWQAAKSFRREQDQATKFLRLKEFYQLEFQCIFAAESKADYYSLCLPRVERMIAEAIRMPSRRIQSERLPAYSLKTWDVEVRVEPERWLEVCSISLRTDFPQIQSRRMLVLEIALGLDRLTVLRTQPLPSLIPYKES